MKPQSTNPKRSSRDAAPGKTHVFSWLPGLLINLLPVVSPRRARLLIPPTLGLIVWSGPSLAGAESTRDQVAEGNAAYRNGQFAQALAAYERATVDLPESPELYFNKGAVWYRQEEYGKAAEAFEAAALKTRDLRFEARCKYNLGNCAFREAERRKDGDLAKAIEGYQKSVRHYQEALKLDATLADAAHNIEVARLLMKDLIDKLKQQQESQKEQREKQQEQLDKLKKLIERQQEVNAQNQKLADEKGQKGASENLKDRIQQLGGTQDAVRDDTKKLSDELAQPPPSPAQSPPTSSPPTPSPPAPAHPPPAPVPSPQAAQAKTHLDRAVTEQSVAGERLRRQHLEEARPPQEKALDELEKALASLAGPPQPQPGQDTESQEPPRDQKNQASQQQQQQQPAARPPDEQAHDILKEEKENHDRQRRSQRGGYRPVDKDW
jgi:hypothetical protein